MASGEQVTNLDSRLKIVKHAHLDGTKKRLKVEYDRDIDIWNSGTELEVRLTACLQKYVNCISKS